MGTLRGYIYNKRPASCCAQEYSWTRTCLLFLEVCPGGSLSSSDSQTGCAACVPCTPRCIGVCATTCEIMTSKLSLWTALLVSVWPCLARRLSLSTCAPVRTAMI
ncbi:hypothetical protein OE88DRAFT_1034421 [Heliocybe sulcata]|uniref:Uncharacterized protein n=1 Tax=Heliocybe sulcata TaxID=5364 RepID=A0A5C3NEL0_9AGAM|nr:hypothetical protein OE88DRAFT_1034421 [Heliocybe sulcata]